MVVGLTVVLGAFAASYVATHRADRTVALGPTELAAAPEPVPALTTRPARPATKRALPTVSAAWVTAYAARTGIPARALTAYADASLRAPCSIGWTTLAGLGWVESQHGTIGGRTLAADGRPDRPVVGPDLDGRGRLAAVRGPNGAWEHAVGPMQFLPSTWSRWSSDGDGDGRSDPQDLDDASLAAARYLCAAGQDLGTGAGWSAAVRSYNHSDAYVRAVYDAAAAYAARSAS